jgi:gamma-D-glutamyl-L-lysine dipeptidyl-peptidase
MFNLRSGVFENVRIVFLLSAILVFNPSSFFAHQASSPPAAGNASASDRAIAATADYVVIKPVVNMYREASLQSDVVSQAIYATNLQRVKTKHGWADIRTGDNYTGWIQLSNVRKVNGHAYASTGLIVRVSQLSSNIYREADVTKHAPIVTIPWESRLEVLSDKLEDSERWLEVRLPDGSTGYVQRGDVSSDFTPLTIDQVIALAKKFLGVTYTWGGTSDFGFDCSGFMQMLMRQRGIIMPRDADLQAAWIGVTPVERQDLQPGDLLFFGSGPEHITHTGMYIGNGEFIHDTVHEHPGVQISVLDDKPWTTLLVAARRPKS